MADADPDAAREGESLAEIAEAPPLAIAHRGGTAEAPENTLEALALPSRWGRYLEVDAHMTRGVVVAASTTPGWKM